MPFEIPDTWEWCRLGTVFQHNTGKALNSSNQQGTKMQYITTSNLYWDRFELDKLKEMLFTESEIEKCTVTKGDLLVCEGGDIGRAAIWNYDYPMRIQNHIHRLRPYATVDMYFFYFIFNLYKHSGLIGGKGIGIQGLSSNAIDKLLIPLPSLSEQHRIVAKIEELLPYIEKYAQAETQLTALNTSFPEALKKSILQEAVQGRLVPQNPDDESASVLLERIRAEKQALVKAGKIKKDKHESVIVTRDKVPYEIIDGKERCIAGEVPFEIPEGWCWCRLSHICQSITDGDHQPPPQVPNGKPFIVISNVSSGKIDFSNTRYVPEEYYNKLDNNRKPIKNDILFTVTGSYGIVMKVENDREFCFQRHIALLKPLFVDSDFLVHWLRTPLVYEQCKETATGTAQKTVSLTSLKNIIIPIPPLEEQHRIVTKIEELMKLCKIL